MVTAGHAHESPWLRQDMLTCHHGYHSTYLRVTMVTTVHTHDMVAQSPVIPKVTSKPDDEFSDNFFFRKRFKPGASGVKAKMLPQNQQDNR